MTDKTNTSVPDGIDFFAQLWEESWTYIKTVVDVVREPVLILDKNLCVLAANESFYRTFQVELKDTEGTLVYKLGNGQWDIPDLRRLLETILPKNTFFKGFRVTHDFPSIGRKIMILNARQIHYTGTLTTTAIPPIIMLAMEDVTEVMDIAEAIAGHAEDLEARFNKERGMLDQRFQVIQNDLEELKKFVSSTKE